MKKHIRNYRAGIIFDTKHDGLETTLNNPLLVHVWRIFSNIAGWVLAASMVWITPSVAADNLVFKSDFETGQIGSWGRHDGGIPGALTVQSGVKRAGKYAVKLHMERCAHFYNDKSSGKHVRRPLETPQCQPVSTLNRPRAQLGGGRNHRFSMNKDYWIGWSVFIPKNWVDDHKSSDNFLNLHHAGGKNGPGTCTRAPQPFEYRIQGNRWQFLYTKNTGNHSSGKIDLAPVDKGRWTDWVINFKLSYGSDGFFKIWNNGRQVHNFSGITICKGKDTSHAINTLPSMNATVYKPDWDLSPSVKERTVYYDEIRVGNSSASYRDVVPHGAATLDASTTPVQKATTSAQKKPSAKKKRTAKKKRIKIRTCNKYKGKRRANCRRRVIKHNRSVKR